ncbi:MAG TPA: hypothetical protein VGK59_18815 [Ohtaekwangia sp.]
MKQGDEIIWTYRPDGKKGTQISRAQYNLLASFILNVLNAHEEVTLQQLLEKAQAEISESIDSDVAWYILQVKLDLEARDLVRVISSSHNRRLFLLKITRAGQKRIRLEKQLSA